MKKKLRDMVVGDRFIGIYSGNEVRVIFVSSDLVLADQGTDFCGVGRYARCTDLDCYREMVEPEPEWLYESICDDGAIRFIGNNNKTTCISETLVAVYGGQYRTITNGRKLHPDTLEIVE